MIVRRSRLNQLRRPSLRRLSRVPGATGDPMRHEPLDVPGPPGGNAMRIVATGSAWLRRIVDIALIGLIVIVLGGVALGKLVPLTGRATVVIGGGSMAPVIPLGSAVVIAPIDTASLVSGDVVSLRIAAENTPFTHRIVDIVDRADGRWIRTKGDANPQPDPTLVPATAVL